ncbi:unnamed protein product [Rotaria sp. Silwood2]|nr:unnamed protein product [Rotaria sp. Silwood2]CAF4507733.1 unnamed protein product [Rotaria sp. Silwood2]
MKGSLLLVSGIILLNYCANSTLKDVNIIQTTKDEDQCIKTTIVTGINLESGKLINRGASSRCQSYSSKQISIICCQLDYCNA